jgi:hypothetical protein
MQPECPTDEDIMNRSVILVARGLGAGLMYALDPQLGNRRRARARDKLSKAAHRTGRVVGATSRDVANRATGLAASLQSRFFESDAPDEVIEARVRARLGRLSSHPGAVEITVRDGAITLRGPAFRSELAGIVRGVSSVRGVTRVDNRLEAHDVGEHVPALQGRPARIVSPIAYAWPPALKSLVGAGGAALTTLGLLRHDKAGMWLAGLGLAMVTRAVADTGLPPFATIVAFCEQALRGVSIPVKVGPRPDRPQGPRPSGPMSTRVH